MEFVICYLSQEKIDVIEGFLGRKMVWEEKDRMFTKVRTSDQRSADRLVEHLRLTGHIAFIQEYE